MNITYSQASTDQTGTVYIGNFEYNTLNGNSALTTLSRIYNDEGYVENPANPQYYYFRHDHLGDNREVWCANSNTVAQRTQYYASGLPFAYDRTVDHPDLQHRKYNGKEFVEMHGYDTYDIVWRQYYPAIGRFQTPDPEVENDYDLSPYTMCDNNMVLKVDPDGRQAALVAEESYAYYLSIYKTGQPPTTPNVSGDLSKGLQYIKTMAVVAVATLVNNVSTSTKAVTDAFKQATNSTKVSTTQNAKASTPEGVRNQRRNEKRETAKQNKTDIHMNEAIKNNVGQSSPDGSAGGPKKPLDKWSKPAFVLFAIGVAAELKDMPKPEKLPPAPIKKTPQFKQQTN